MSNERLCQRARQMPVEQEIRQRRWMWIGHILRNPVISSARQALTWNTKGKRKIQRPTNTRRRDLEADVEETVYSLRQLDWR